MEHIYPPFCFAIASIDFHARIHIVTKMQTLWMWATLQGQLRSHGPSWGSDHKGLQEPARRRERSSGTVQPRGSCRVVILENLWQFKGGKTGAGVSYPFWLEKTSHPPNLHFGDAEGCAVGTLSWWATETIRSCISSFFQPWCSLKFTCDHALYVRVHNPNGNLVFQPPHPFLSWNDSAMVNSWFCLHVFLHTQLNKLRLRFVCMTFLYI